jgi:hypothetical protein
MNAPTCRPLERGLPAALLNGFDVRPAVTCTAVLEDEAHQTDLLADRVDGVTYKPAVSRATLQTIKTFASQELTILLPSHDPEGLGRLANRTTL